MPEHDGVELMKAQALHAANERLREDRDRFGGALEMIRDLPTVVRNPDGIDQAAATMKLIARDALARTSPAEQG